MISEAVYRIFQQREYFLLLFDLLSTVLVIAPIGLLFGWWLYQGLIKRKWYVRLAAEVAVGLLLALVLASFLKMVLPSLRPSGYYYEQLQQFDSFPSRHTLIIATVAFLLLPVSLEAGLALLLDAVVVGLLRVLSLNHWLVDVMASWLFGLVVAIIVVKGFQLLLPAKSQLSAKKV